MLKTGDRIGHLTILEDLGGINKKRKFKVRCDCGKELITTRECLRKERQFCSARCPLYENLVGKRFGRLTVIRFVEAKSENRYWECKCDCGNTIVRNTHHLKAIKSCGCLALETRTKHNMSHSRLYGIWQNMKDRCFNTNNDRFNLYGGRGIQVCDDWLDFNKFKLWALANDYSDNLTLDRIDVNGNYEPSNCRWTTRLTQSNNTRQNRHIVINGEDRTMAEWARIYGINYQTLQFRLKKGMTPLGALITPVKKRNN